MYSNNVQLHFFFHIRGQLGFSTHFVFFKDILANEKLASLLDL